MAEPLFKIINFPGQSYIILEGEKKSSNFYIIREGKVNVKRTNPLPGEKASEVLGPGDFFGVISAMSQYPQVESAISMGDVSLISVSNYRFGELIQKNTPVAMKIIRYFSVKLRQFGDFKQSGQKFIAFKDPTESLEQIFQFGEYYFNEGNPEVATYCFQAYLSHLPTGKSAAKAKKQLEVLDQPLTLPPPQSSSNRSFKQHDMIFCENEPGKELFIVQSGKVKISKINNDGEIVLNIMQPGDIFGEMALIDDKPRSASAIALESVELLVIHKKNFEGMVKTQPQLMSRIITLLSERIWTSYKNISNSMIQDVQGRIADLCLTLAEKSRVKIASRAHFSFGIGIPDILKMLGLSEYRDQNVMMKFITNNQFIQMEGENLVCTDLSLLERLVQTYHKK
ncbi:MAG: cyclic nucleotide-binding domain-containing protein [Leptospiraceae bacterium]|nr:cyclic nucleotide-binding domain-containing protein [Leptospiraceae bacterium]MCP5495335.1 cyclic nucleotide-binding domain-containing protein [Leptospiraceae bacterium]